MTEDFYDTQKLEKTVKASCKAGFVAEAGSDKTTIYNIQETENIMGGYNERTGDRG
jgi:hypothetical protein